MQRGEKGAVLPFVAITLTVILGFAGMSVDVGFLEYRQQQQQNAADAAALGGAQALAGTSCTSSSAGRAAAITDAADNGYSSGVTVNTPPSSGPYAGNACAVYVQINQTQRTFLTRLLRPAGMAESTEAVGAAVTTGPGCIYLLSMTQPSNMNGTSISSPKCGIYINDTSNFNGSTVNTSSIGYAGAAPNENGSTFQQATPAPMLPVQDPCPEIAGCNYWANNTPAATGCPTLSKNGYTGVIASGCYSGFSLNGCNVTLSGTYIFTGSSNFNGSQISGTGVTIVVTSTGNAPNFNGVNLSLTPPSTGNGAGVLYYQVPGNTQSPNFNGSSNNLKGLIYAPSATGVNFNGAAGGYLVLVFGSTNMNGSSSYDFATPPPNQSLVYQGALTQ